MWLQDVVNKYGPAEFTGCTEGLQTRGGYPARFIAHLKNGEPAPFVFEIKGRMENYFPNGRYNLVHESDMDIVLKTL